jgi:hypothetical protein
MTENPEAQENAEKGAWRELGGKMEALGLKLKLHFEQTNDGDAKDALGKIKEGVQEAFEAAGNAVKDDAVRGDVREAGKLLADALSETINKATDAVKRKM